jgi:hypothetical protein
MAADPRELRLRRFCENDAPVRVFPCREEREAVRKQVGTSGFKDVLTMDKKGDQPGEPRVVPTGELKRREPMQSPAGESDLAVPTKVVVGECGTPEAHQDHGRRCRCLAKHQGLVHGATSLLQRQGETGRDLVFRTLEDVGIHAEGHGRVGVAQPAGHGADVVTAADGLGRRPVAQVM